MRIKLVLVSLISLLVVVISSDIVVAQGSESIEWVDAVEVVIEFFIRVLQLTAESLQDSLDQFTDMFGSTEET